MLSNSSIKANCLSLSQSLHGGTVSKRATAGADCGGASESWTEILVAELLEVWLLQLFCDTIERSRVLWGCQFYRLACKFWVKVPRVCIWRDLRLKWRWDLKTVRTWRLHIRVKSITVDIHALLAMTVWLAQRLSLCNLMAEGTENTVSNSSSIVACIFVAMHTCLLSHYLAAGDFFSHPVTICYLFPTVWEYQWQNTQHMASPNISICVTCSKNEQYIVCKFQW
jgi:hypothetical protein